MGQARPGAALILLTGQRPGEVAAMQRGHIVEGWWQMPGKPRATGRGPRTAAITGSGCRAGAGADREPPRWEQEVEQPAAGACRRPQDRARHAARPEAYLPDDDHAARLRSRRDGPGRQSQDQQRDRRLRPPRLRRRGPADHGGGGAARPARRRDGDEQRGQPEVRYPRLRGEDLSGLTFSPTFGHPTRTRGLRILHPREGGSRTVRPMACPGTHRIASARVEFVGRVITPTTFSPPPSMRLCALARWRGSRSSRSEWRIPVTVE